MAFNANDRVRVTSQNSEFRRHLGTVLTPAASAADGFNKVRIDGYPAGKTVNLADDELADTNFSSPISY